jgi:hypothetical protein
MRIDLVSIKDDAIQHNLRNKFAEEKVDIETALLTILVCEYELE